MTEVCDIEFLTIEEAAELLRVKPGTLDNWRSEKDGPPHRRHGARIVYERTELLKWSEERRARTPQSDERNKSPARRDGNAGG
jgi:hypothetical protein